MEWNRLPVEVRWMELVVRHYSEQAELEQQKLADQNKH